MMYLEIISPDNQMFEGQVKLVQVPGSQSPFTVLEKHTAIISTLEKGKVRVIDDKDETHIFHVKGGVIEVLNNKIVILAD